MKDIIENPSAYILESSFHNSNAPGALIGFSYKDCRIFLGCAEWISAAFKHFVTTRKEGMTMRYKRFEVTSINIVGITFSFQHPMSLVTKPFLLLERMTSSHCTRENFVKVESFVRA